MVGGGVRRLGRRLRGRWPSRDPIDAGLGELDTIAVAPTAWRHGVGRRLMDCALADLRNAGYRDAILWTLADHEQGRTFYEATGWRASGEARDTRRQVAFRRSLRDAEPMTAEHQENDVRNARLAIQVYDAVAIAARDAHAVLDTVMGASDQDTARGALQDRFGFTEVQAQAVLDLQFRKLTSTDLRAIEQHRQELVARVALLEGRLGDDGAVSAPA